MTNHELQINHLTMGHKINSHGRIQWFLDKNLDIAEADVLLGKYKNEANCAILAHPPDTSSDLSFEDFLQSAVQNDFSIKVDFKVPEVIDPVIQILKKTGFPENKLILNADVIQGEFGLPPVFHMKDMVNLRNHFCHALISIGHTTSQKTPPFCKQDIENLIRLGGEIGGPVTHVLRADLIYPSSEPVLDWVGNRHLTLYCSDGSREMRDFFTKSLEAAFFDLFDSRNLNPV